MFRKTAMAAILAAGMLGGAQGVSAQTAGNSMTCPYPWCVNYVEVTQDPSGTPMANVYWKEMRMRNRLSDATVIWILVGSPDYEMRLDSAIFRGPNSDGAFGQFPLRMVAADRYARDDLNNNSLTYNYEVRVYKKGAPPGTLPVVGTGAVIVNSFN
jgi:hypothetical protein